MRRLKRIGGGSLVEALIAALMVGLALLGIVNVYAFAVNMTARQERVGLAHRLARDASESLRAMSYASSPDVHAIVYFDAVGQPKVAGHPEAVLEMTKTLTTLTATTRTKLSTGHQQVIAGLRETSVVVRYLDDTNQAPLTIRGVLPEVRE